MAQGVLSATGGDAPALPTALERSLFAGLCLWGVGVQLNEGLAAAGMVLCALGLFARAARAGPLPWRRVLRGWAPLWAFVAWAALAPALAGRPPTSSGVARMLDWVGLPVAAGAVAALGPGRRRALALACGAVFLLSCATAALQHFGHWPSEAALAPLAWTRLPFYRMYETVPGDPSRFMAGGLLLHRLKFANVGGLCVLWALALGLAQQGRLRAPGLTVAALGFLSEVAFPYARAASVALVASLTCLLLLQLRDRRRALLVGAALTAVALGVVAGIPSLRQRFLGSNLGEGSGDRPYFIAAALRAVQAHPLVGVGPGRFRPSLYAVPGTPRIVLEHTGKSHNQLLSLAAEIGVPGAALFCVLLVWLWRRMRGNGVQAVAGRACLVFFALVSLLHDPLYHAEPSMALVLALGLGLGLAPGPEDGAPPER